MRMLVALYCLPPKTARAVTSCPTFNKAREADQSSMKVAYATRKDVEGMKLSAVPPKQQ